MSRIGKKPVTIPSGVSVSVQGAKVLAKGPQGEVDFDVHPDVTVSVANGQALVSVTGDTRQIKSLHVLTLSLVANMVEGVNKGYKKDLEIQGVGFKAAMQGTKLVLALGFSSPKEFVIPAGVKVTVDGGVNLTVAGADLQKVGNVAARIRSFYPAEPYKGKGVRYKGEYVRRKVGKTVA